jgi:hypothetical protein
MPVGSGALNYSGQTITVNRALAELHPPPPYLFEDFLVDVLADSPYVTVTQSGTPVTAAAISATAGDPNAQYGGWVAGGTDDVDAEVDEVAIGGLGTSAGTPWLRADRLGSGIIAVEWGITIPAALTARQYFAGISDDPVEGTATNGAMSIQATTTITDVATDAAGWIFSSLASTPTFWKFGATDSGTQDTAVDGGVGVADTWRGMRTEIDVNGDCYFFTRATRGGALTMWGKSANGLSPDVALLPYFSAAPTTTTSVPWEIDYCYAIAAVIP